MNDGSFSNWRDIYMESVGELSKSTWQKGILLEVQKREIQSGTVLDLGAGNGVGSDLLKNIGTFQVTALDKSQGMLELNRTADRKIVGDFVDLKGLHGPYDLIVSGFDSLNYLIPKCLPEFFNRIGKILHPSGLLIFDYSSPKFLSTDWCNAQFSQELVGGRLDWKTKFDQSEGRCDLKLEYWVDQKKEWTETHSQYSISAYQMHDALSGTNLSINYVRNLDGKIFTPQANTHVYVIRRNDNPDLSFE